MSSIITTPIRSASPIHERTGGDSRASSVRAGLTSCRSADLAVVAFAAVWLAASWPKIGAPLGFSHDGRNAGVFGSTARALVADPLGSHLGSHLADGNGVYSNHPPLVNWLLALGHAVLGDDPAGLRLPMAVAALVLIAGTYRLLRCLVVSPWHAAIGTIAGLGAPMFFAYGTMPDTPMLGLPLGVLLLGSVVAAETAPPSRPWRIALIAALSALAGWEALFFAGVIAVVTIVRERRNAEPGARHNTGWRVLAGLVIGTAITVSWIAWADGGLARLADQFLFRTGGRIAGAGPGDAAVQQVLYVADVYGPVIALAILAAVPAMRVPAVRRHLPVVVGVCLAYQVGFWQGASVHDYWSYWWQLPMAMCFAGALETWSHTMSSRTTVGRPALLTGAAAMLLLVVGPVWTVTRTSEAARQYESGLGTARLLDTARRPSDQDAVLMLGVGDPVSWASWSTHLPVERLTLATLRSTASAHPRWKVLVHCAAIVHASGTGVCAGLAASTPRAGDLVMVEAGVLSASIPDTDHD